MKIAVFADIHLPDHTGTVKEEILDWALAAAVENGADLIAGAGDLTAVGSVTAARRLMEKLQAAALPLLLTPGNAELRTPADTGKILQLMATPSEYSGVCSVDSSRSKLDRRSSEFLQQLSSSKRKNQLLITHCPPSAWDTADQKILAELLDRRIITRVVYGHKHVDINDERFSGIRGLDPDKASGGAPALVFFEQEPDGSWKRMDLVCPQADAANFPEAARHAIWNSIGISGMQIPVENLEIAVRRQLPVFEVRFSGNKDFPSAELCSAVNSWRRSGGKYLSMHMTELQFDGNNFSGMEMLENASRAAVKLGCDGVTLHVPRGFADELSDDEKIENAARLISESLRMLFEHNISVGVENLHTSTAERAGKRYKFGCTGEECMKFINALRRKRPGHKIGLHLDIGHARNNAPFSSTATLSDWYAEYGSEIVAMHIHQVSRNENGELKNHTGFDHFYGMLISLASLAMARKNGQIGTVPMILELRCPAEPTLNVLQEILKPQL